MSISLSGWGTGALPTLGWGLGGFVEGLSFGIWPEIGIDTEVFEPEIEAESILPQLSATRGPIADLEADSLVPAIVAAALASADMTASCMERPVMTSVRMRPHIDTACLRTSEKLGTLLPSQEAKEGLRPSIGTDIEEIG
jgi:hypothetical protein